MDGELPTQTRYKLACLPALKQVQILIFHDFQPAFNVEACKANIRVQLDVLLAGRQVDITFDIAVTSFVEQQKD